MRRAPDGLACRASSRRLPVAVPASAVARAARRASRRPPKALIGVRAVSTTASTSSSQHAIVHDEAACPRLAGHTSSRSTCSGRSVRRPTRARSAASSGTWDESKQATAASPATTSPRSSRPPRGPLAGARPGLRMLGATLCPPPSPPPHRRGRHRAGARPLRGREVKVDRPLQGPQSLRRPAAGARQGQVGLRAAVGRRRALGDRRAPEGQRIRSRPGRARRHRPLARGDRRRRADRQPRLHQRERGRRKRPRRARRSSK